MLADEHCAGPEAPRTDVLDRRDGALVSGRALLIDEERPVVLQASAAG